jgi:flagellar protein FlaI
MSLELKPTVRFLQLPREVECIDKYEVEGLYGVCVTPSKEYIIYDKVLTERDLSDLEKSVQELLRSVITRGEREVSGVIERADVAVKHILQRQFFGYGVVEPLILDDNIIDIHVLSGRPIRVTHRRHGELDTRIVLSEEELKELVLRLSTLAGKVISEATPLASFIEPRYETRVSVVYYSDVTLRRGLTVDIRKQPKKPWSIIKLLDAKTLSPDEVAFLWLAVKYKIPVMIVGEMMSGKTTVATAILNLTPPKSKIITIEDAPEIRLCTPYWTRTTTRESPENPVTVFSLLRVALRLSVDYVVVGEVRGEEARDWAQAILLGHGAVTTFHADSPQSALLRLTTPPISVNPQALRMLNVFVKMIPIRREASLERRAEIYVYDEEKLTPLYTYDPARDEIKLNPSISSPIKSFSFFKRASLAHGISLDDLEREFECMRKIIVEVHSEAKKIDPKLEEPDICMLSEILYKRLREDGFY